MPTPNPHEHRPTSSGETPLQAAPPIPGAAPLPMHPEQRLGPAPALPVSGGAAAGGTAAERPLARAPLPARPAAAVPQIPAAPVVPRPGPGRPGPQELPVRPVTGGPIGSRPEVPLARPGEVRGAAWAPPSAVPVAGPAPAFGVAMPAANPAALYGTTAGALPAAPAGQPSAPSMPGQPTPPSGPAWFQPPANPPPVPPPSAGSQPLEPPRPIAWSPHAQSGPVGSGVTAALSGSVQPASARTNTAKSLRRESRARSAVLAVTFLLVAATFLIGMVVVLLISLAS